MPMAAADLGCFATYMISSYVDCTQHAVILLFIPIIFFILFAFLPATPMYLQHSAKNEVGSDADDVKMILL